MKNLPVTILLIVLSLGLWCAVPGCGQSAESTKTMEEAPLPPEAAKHFEKGVQALQANKIPGYLSWSNYNPGQEINICRAEK
jgi:hypothetical protein